MRITREFIFMGAATIVSLMIGVWLQNDGSMFLGNCMILSAGAFAATMAIGNAAQQAFNANKEYRIAIQMRYTHVFTRICAHFGRELVETVLSSDETLTEGETKGDIL